MTSKDRARRFLMGAVLALSSVVAFTLAEADVVHAAACSPTVTTVGSDTVLSFTTVGTCTWSVPPGVTEVRALVIGGGGAGGKSTNVGGSGGGGAGAMVVHPAFSVSGTMTIVVGDGALAQTTFDRGGSGQSSSLGALVAIGGGGGGDWCDWGCQSTYPAPPSPQIPGADGGSGGGSGAGLSNSSGGVVSSQTLPSGATSYGNKGGDAVSGGNFHGAGGGGAGAAGANRTSSSNPPTAGGIGRQSDITGTNVYYAAGGGGSGGATNTYAVGGLGGGGDGGGNNNSPAATAGQANTGSGGGGGQNGPGGAGGSGIVIVRFATVPINSVAPSISGTLQVGDVLTSSTGTWSGAPNSFAYQWKRAATAGGAYSNISTATSSSYTLTDDDIGKHLKVEVTATNVNGAGTPVTTSSVGPVTDLPDATTPTLGSTTSTADGFTFTITNYSATYTYTFIATSGSATQTAGVVTVTGVGAGTSSTVTVRASRTGYKTASAIVTGSAKVAPTTTTIATTTTLAAVVTTTVIPAVDIFVTAPTTATGTISTGTTLKPTKSNSATAVTATTSVVAAAATSTTSTTSTTLPNNVGGTVAPTPPEPHSVVAGQAGLTVGDTELPASVTRQDNQLIVTAGDFTAAVGAVTSDGTVSSLDVDGNVRLRPGDTVRITLQGFKPGTTVEAWLFSSPVLLGSTKVGADGRVVGNFDVPSEAPNGAHRIAVVARTVTNESAMLTVGVMVGEWDKGPNVTLWLIILPIVLAVLGALTLPATRRRRRTA